MVPNCLGVHGALKHDAPISLDVCSTEGKPRPACSFLQVRRVILRAGVQGGKGHGAVGHPHR
jgi:hypothetical protein